MTSHDLKINAWTSHASHFIGNCFDLSLPFLDRNSNHLDPLVRFVLAQLYISCLQTADSILVLLREQKEWDASILERVLTEGCIKFSFIAHGSEQEIRVKAEEYWITLPDTFEASRQTRAETLLGVVGEENFKPIRELLLTEEELIKIKSKLTKDAQKILQQKWSFSELIKYFSNHISPEFQMFKALSFGYGLGSHLIHKDAVGIGMEWERTQRPKREREAVALAHMARLVSSASCWPWINTMFLLKICEKDLSQLKSLKTEYSALFEELELANHEFEQIEYGTRET